MSDNTGDLDQVVEALKELLNDGSDSDESNDSNSGGSHEDKSFFCVEDSLLARNVKVSVKGVGPLSYPIKEDIIQNLIGISEKAKFGKGTKTVLDTSYRDTQTIPADKLKVEIDEQVLNNLLQSLRQALNIEDHSDLEIHLYNMLIYGPGQFFKRHRDTEKVKNMIATLVMVLPSPHKGGDLIIQHHSLKHRFFGSLNHEIIKCIAFYSDCYHEVKEVDEGYRVALTYNVEIKSGPIPDLMSVDENLKDAVNNYFEETKSDMLVYFLDHQYTEHSLRWYMLKGSDRICGKALLAVGKLEGYSPCLALADYQKSWPEDCEDEVQKYIDFYFWIDENNITLKLNEISVSEDKICFMKDTEEEFAPYKREEEGHMGNWAGNIDEWYHRSAVVLWRDTWAFLTVSEFKKEVHALHLLTAQPGMKTALLKKVRENSGRFFSSRYWEDESVRKMALEIMVYLNDKDVTSKTLVKYKPSEVLDLTKNEIASWVGTNCDLETWKVVMKAWESTRNSEKLLKSVLPFLLNYMTKEDKDLGIAGYLLDESAKIFMNLKRENNYSYSYLYNSNKKDSNLEKDKQLCLLLQISFQLGKLDLEKQLMKNTDSKCAADNFKIFEETLHPEQFARISIDLLSNMTNAVLEKIKKDDYIYARPNQAYIQDICSFLQICSKIGNKDIERKIINQIMSNPAFTASYLADLIVKMKQALGDNMGNFGDFKNLALNVIEAELQKFKNPNDSSLSISHPCNCQYCSQVQRFFASTSSMQLIIPAAEKNRTHIYSYVSPFARYLPIKVEIIRQGSPHKLSVTKLPKLLEDRKYLINTLIQARKVLVQIEDDAPAAKKTKTQ